MLMRSVSSCLLLAFLVACSRAPTPAESDDPSALTEPTRDPAGDSLTDEDPEEDTKAADDTDDVCPEIVKPGPDFCPDGEIVRREEDGCLRGYDCVESRAEDEPCPDIARPAPGFCPDGEIVRREKDGCLRGYDCVTP